LPSASVYATVAPAATAPLAFLTVTVCVQSRYTLIAWYEHWATMSLLSEFTPAPKIASRTWRMAALP
jgi:hypothetical protein